MPIELASPHRWLARRHPDWNLKWALAVVAIAGAQRFSTWLNLAPFGRTFFDYGPVAVSAGGYLELRTFVALENDLFQKAVFVPRLQPIPKPL